LFSAGGCDFVEFSVFFFFAAFDKDKIDYCCFCFFSRYELKNFLIDFLFLLLKLCWFSLNFDLVSDWFGLWLNFVDLKLNIAFFYFFLFFGCWNLKD
jgi:hypothetical protein